MLVNQQVLGLCSAWKLEALEKIFINSSGEDNLTTVGKSSVLVIKKFFKFNLNNSFKKIKNQSLKMKNKISLTLKVSGVSQQTNLFY